MKVSCYCMPSNRKVSSENVINFNKIIFTSNLCSNILYVLLSFCDVILIVSTVMANTQLTSIFCSTGMARAFARFLIDVSTKSTTIRTDCKLNRYQKCFAKLAFVIFSPMLFSLKISINRNPKVTLQILTDEGWQFYAHNSTLHGDRCEKPDEVGDQSTHKYCFRRT